MTPDEFRAVMNKHYLPALPDTKAWATKQDASTRAAWAAMFDDVEVRDLCAACMHHLKTEPIEAYQREQTFQIIRKTAKWFQAQRRSKEESARLRQQGTRGAWDTVTKKDPYMAEAFRRVTAEVDKQQADREGEPLPCDDVREITKAIEQQMQQEGYK